MSAEPEVITRLACSESSCPYAARLRISTRGFCGQHLKAAESVIADLLAALKLQEAADILSDPQRPASDCVAALESLGDYETGWADAALAAKTYQEKAREARRAAIAQAEEETE